MGRTTTLTTLKKAVADVFIPAVRKSAGSVADMCLATLAYLERDETVRDLLAPHAQVVAKVRKSVKGQVLYNWLECPFSHLPIAEFVDAFEGSDTLQYQLHKIAGGYGEPPHEDLVDDVQKFRRADDASANRSREKQDAIAELEDMVSARMRELHASDPHEVIRTDILLRVIQEPEGRRVMQRILATPAPVARPVGS